MTRILKFWFAFILILSLVAQAAPAQAQSAIMRITPASITINPGDSFTVTVEVVAGAGQVDGAEVHLNFNPALLNVTGVTGGTALPVPIISAVFNNTAGTVDYAAGTFSAFPTGTFVLLTINFTAIASTPGTPLDIVQAGVPRQSDITFGGASILGSIQDGTVIVTGFTPPTDTPIPPTNTPVPPTNTPAPPTNTPIPPPPTNTPLPPPPTNTPDPSIPTNTPAPPTNTPIPPPPSNTPLPGVPTNTPLPPPPPPATPIPGVVPTTAPPPDGGGSGGLPPFCRDFGGSTDNRVRASVPPRTATLSDGSEAGVFCRILTIPEEISVSNETILLAVDVFSLSLDGRFSVTRFNNTVQVCLAGAGALLFRDANNAPRVTVPISSVISGGFTCGSIPNAGTVVLVQRAGVVTATPNPNVPPPVTGGVVHIVQRGESLFRISLRYGITLQAIISANGISDPRRIFVGQRLIIPTGGTQQPPAPTTTPRPAAPTATLRPGAPTSVPTATVVGTRTHVVRAGENLFRIALRYGLTTEQLARANGITNPSLIFPGQVLVIPPR